jgi:hypothetical protein
LPNTSPSTHGPVGRLSRAVLADAEGRAGFDPELGAFAQEYGPHAGRLVGNFPQAFSHVGLTNTAHNLAPGEGPAEHRKES